MKKKYFYLLIIVMFGIIVGCTGCTKKTVFNDKFTVAVGIVPLQNFVNEVSGDEINVVTLIPPGASPANYQPQIQEMKMLSDADVYFTLEMPAEKENIINHIHEYNQNISIIKLNEIVNDVYEPMMSNGEIHDHKHDGYDPHLWLSLKRSVVMVQEIAKVLSEIDSENEKTYKKNADEYIQQLLNLDNNIRQSANTNKSKKFIIYHGAYAYFADDYGFKMISIESNGKKAVMDDIVTLIDIAKKEGINTVFYQEEFDNSQARMIAKEINGKTIKVSPLAKNYLEQMKYFSDALLNMQEN